MKMAICAARVPRQRKDFGGAGGGPGGVKGGRRGCTGDQRKRSLSIVCPLQEDLVRAALADYDKTFGGGQGHGQERLYPEPAQSAKVRAGKGREIQIMAVLASVLDLYGCQVVPRAICWCQVVTRWSRVVPGSCRGVAGWL